MIMTLIQNSIFLENMLLSKTSVLTELKYQHTNILCTCGQRYWIGILSNIDEAAGDVKVKAMHSHYPGVSFF